MFVFAVKHARRLSILPALPQEMLGGNVSFLPPLAASSKGVHVSESASKVSVASYKTGSHSGCAAGSHLQSFQNERNRHEVYEADVTDNLSQRVMSAQLRDNRELTVTWGDPRRKWLR